MSDHEPTHIQQTYYDNQDMDFLENLFHYTEFFLKQTANLLFILFFIILTLGGLVLAPPIIKYHMNPELQVEKPIIFEVKGESYPDINDINWQNNDGINLETIPDDE